jgi:hypothetical protein
MKLFKHRELTKADWIGIFITAAFIVIAREWRHLF